MKKLVVFLNGRTEWIEKYHYLPDDLRLSSETGFLVIDHRGQGGSGGERSFVDSYDDYAADTKQIIDKVAKDKPYVVLAHSMGSLIALYSLLHGYISPQRLVLLSPLLGIPNYPLPSWIARALSFLFSVLGGKYFSTMAGNYEKTDFRSNKLTHSLERFEAIMDTPYIVPGATFGWVASTFRAMDAVFDKRKLSTLKIPLLIMIGSQENVVNGKAVKKWFDLTNEMTSFDLKYHEISGAKHELLSELPEYYEETIKKIRAWFADFCV